MKKNFFAFAAAVLMLGMTACQKEDDNTIANPETGNTLMVKSVADLAGTEWTYTLSFSDIIGVEMGDCAEITGLDLQFGLNFDNSYAHLVFPENVTGTVSRSVVVHQDLDPERTFLGEKPVQRLAEIRSMLKTYRTDTDHHRAVCGETGLRICYRFRLFHDRRVGSFSAHSVSFSPKLLRGAVIYVF